METFPKIQTLFKRDMDGSITGKKGKMMLGEWTTPELEYLAGNEWEFTEKVDGTNIRIQLVRVPDGARASGNIISAKYAGRTDNAVIPRPLLEHLEATFPTLPVWRRDLSRPPYSQRWMELVNFMRDNELDKIILFGEGYGPKIQGGGKYREDISFVLFDVKIGDFWLSRENVNDIASKLGIESVPVLGTGSLYQGINYVKYGTPYLPEEINSIVSKDGYSGWLSQLAGLKSQWGDFEAEGIVARPVVDLFNRKGERIITKVKCIDFK
jgi:hypothetical protein